MQVFLVKFLHTLKSKVIKANSKTIILNIISIFFCNFVFASLKEFQ